MKIIPNLLYKKMHTKKQEKYKKNEKKEGDRGGHVA